METKDVLKTAGKVALTVASPPIGAMTFGKTAKERVGNFLKGAVISTICSLVGTLYQTSATIRLYDAPLVTVGRGPTSYRFLSEISLSPAALFIDQSYVTRVIRDKENLFIQGENIFSYDKETGSYILKFDESVPFSSDSLYLFSLSDARNAPEIDSLRKDLESLTARGDVIGARDAATRYDGAVLENKLAYDKKSEEFASAKAYLEGVVSRMNADLEANRTKLTEKAK